MFANPAFQINFLVLFFFFLWEEQRPSRHSVILLFFLERQQELIRSFVYVSFSLGSEYLYFMP